MLENKMKIILGDNDCQVEIKDSNCKNNMQDILENLIIPALQGLGFSGAEEFFDNKEELPDEAEIARYDNLEESHRDLMKEQDNG